MPYKCADCGKKYSVRMGTFIEGSKLSLQVWLLALYMMTVARKSVLSVQFAKELGVTQKTAWFIANRICKACLLGQDPLGDEVEIDENCLGCEEKRKYSSNNIYIN